VKTKPTAHVYTSDGVAPQQGDPWCTCGLPRQHPVHTLPAVPAEVAAAEQRRMGEADGGQ
jgi:hypothetical protein